MRSASIDKTPGLAAAHPMTHVEALELEEVQNRGGGLEPAQAMHRCGSQVTAIDRNRALLQFEDDDVAEALAALFVDGGIDVVVSARVEFVEGKSGDLVRLSIRHDGEMRTLAGSHLLVATGHTPNTAGLGLELAGMELTESGFIKVNERQRLPHLVSGQSEKSQGIRGRELPRSSHPRLR